MRGLVYKDMMTELHELRRMVLFLLVFAIGMPILFAVTSEDMSQIYGMPMTMCTVIGMVMINNTFGYDERSGWMQYALTGPVSRMQYYHAKFLTHVLNVLCGSALGIVIGTLLAAVTRQLTLAVLGEMLTTSVFSALALCVVGIFLVPLMLKFGVQKGALMFMLIFATVVGVGTALVILLDHKYAIAIPVIAVLALAACITIYLLGRKWVQNKEF